MQEDLLEVREAPPAILLRVTEPVEPVVEDRLADAAERLRRNALVLVAHELVRKQMLLRELAGAGLKLALLLRQFQVHCPSPRGRPVTSPSSAMHPCPPQSTGLMSIS